MKPVLFNVTVEHGEVRLHVDHQHFTLKDHSDADPRQLEFMAEQLRVAMRKLAVTYPKNVKEQ